MAAVTVPDIIPVFPLPGTVLLPSEILPLHIFEPRYRRMVEDVLESHRLIGMIQPAEGQEDLLEGSPEVRDVGCVGLITRHQRLDDGRFLIWLLGLSPFRVGTEVSAEADYRQFRIEPRLHEPDGDEEEAARALRFDLMSAFASQVVARAETLAPFLEQMARADHQQFLAAAAQLLSLSASTRQRMLEESSLLQRFRMIREAFLKRTGRPSLPQESRPAF